MQFHAFQFFNPRFAKLPKVLRPLQWWVWLGFTLILIGLAFGIPRFEFSWGEETPFGHEDPVERSFNQLKDLFGGTDTLMLVFRPTDQNLFSLQTLTALKTIHDTLEQLSLDEANEASPLAHVTDIESIINTSYIEAQENTITYRPFIGDQLPQSPKEEQQLKAQAFDYPTYPRKFFSNDGKYGAFIIRTDFGAIPKEGDSSEAEGTLEFKKHTLGEYADFERAIWKALDHPKIHQALEFEVSPWAAIYRQDVLEKQFKFAFLISIALSGLISLLLFGSLRAVVWPMAVVLSTLTCVLGIAGWTGWAIDLELYIVLALICVVALADSIHIISGYLFFRDHGEDHETAMSSVFYKSGFACLLTSITTAIGMFSLYFVRLDVVQSMGLLSGIGVLIALLITLFVMPLMLHLLPPRSPKKQTSRSSEFHWVQRYLRKTEHLCFQYSTPLIALFLGLMILFSVGVFKVQVDSHYIRDFEPGSSTRHVLELLDQQFLGTSSLEVMIEATPETINQLPVLQAMEQVIDFVQKTYPEWVIGQMSLVRLIKESHQKLNQDDPKYYALPKDQAMLSQILLLIEGENYENLEQVVTVDYQATRLSFSLSHPGTQRSVAIVETIQAELSKLFEPLQQNHPEIKATVTGNLAIFSRLQDYISWSQLRSFGLAFSIISSLLMVIFGSIRIGLVAILPNTFPILTIFGIMGWFGIPLDITTLLIAPIVMGIAVDDTIHFLTHYQMGMAQGKRIREALTETFREVGQALTFTTVILIAASCTFLPVSHVGIARFAILLAIALISALLADIFWLPALCHRFKIKR